MTRKTISKVFWISLAIAIWFGTLTWALCAHGAEIANVVDTANHVRVNCKPTANNGLHCRVLYQIANPQPANTRRAQQQQNLDEALTAILIKRTLLACSYQEVGILWVHDPDNARCYSIDYRLLLQDWNTSSK